MTEENRIFNQVVNYFTESEWDLSQIENESKLLLKYENGRGYEWKCIAIVEEGIAIGKIIFYYQIPESVPITGGYFDKWESFSTELILLKLKLATLNWTITEDLLIVKLVSNLT